jgi:Site-specific DNA methylase
MVVTRPVLRYPGGKFRMAKWIISHFPQHEFYVEPYGGAGSVLMQKPEVRGEIYNDIYSDAVNVFRVLRDPLQAQELERLIRLTPCSYEEYMNAYEFCEDPIERARRTIYRSFMTIGADGVSRKNAGFRGLKNTETIVTAAQEWARYPDVIKAFTKRLRYVLIENRDALVLFKLYDRPTTLFYVDPPYVASTRTNRSAIYAKEMTDEDHIELARILHGLKGMIVLSGYPSALYDQLYADWRKILKSTTVQNGKGRVECLYLSPNINGNKLF